MNHNDSCVSYLSEKHKYQIELFKRRDNFITHFIHYQILDLKLNQNQFGRKLAAP